MTYPVQQGFTDTQLFEGGTPEENAKMVLKKLRAGGLPNTPPAGATEVWAAMVVEWSDALARFDAHVLDRAATAWIRTGVNFPPLASFIAWTVGREREAKEEERALRGSAPCPECGGDRYTTVREGETYLDPRDGETRRATTHFAIPCGTCPEMENRRRLWIDGHFDDEHEVCGRCKEYRLPAAGRRR